MKVDKDNIVLVEGREKQLLEALIKDIECLNELLAKRNENYRQLYIEYITTHTEYSPERVDPCPDYYGMYRLRRIDNNDVIGSEMNIDELDIVCCSLIDFEESRI